MSCHHPRRSFYTGLKNPETGKDVLVNTSMQVDMYPVPKAEKLKEVKIPYNPEFVTKVGDQLFLVNWFPTPCGKCRGCAAKASKEFAVRLALESTLYQNNWFLTLTYNQDCYPKDGKLHKEDLQKFLKRLRDRYGYECFRYFGCGEHGESKGHRCHFHLILLNLDLPVNDLKVKTIRGKDIVFESRLIKECWPFGFHEITDVSLAACSYVAGYVNKKLHDREPDEFRIMSRRPGIGKPWFDLNRDKILDGRVYPPGSDIPSISPGYFDYLLEKCDPELLAKLKLDRKRLGELSADSWIANHTGVTRDEMGFYKDAQFDSNRRKRRIM